MFSSPKLSSILFNLSICFEMSESLCHRLAGQVKLFINNWLKSCPCVINRRFLWEPTTISIEIKRTRCIRHFWLHFSTSDFDEAKLFYFVQILNSQSTKEVRKTPINCVSNVDDNYVWVNCDVFSIKAALALRTRAPAKHCLLR